MRIASFAARKQVFDVFFGITHGKLFCKHHVKRIIDGFLAAERQKRACMSRGDIAACQKVEHIGRQTEKPQRIGQIRPGNSDDFGGFLLGKTEFVDQAFETARHFDRVQILALEVLDKHDGTCFGIV